jgi:hypothetical protein
MRRGLRRQQAGISPDVVSNVLLTIFQDPSILASVKKSSHDKLPQMPSSSTIAVAASVSAC